MTCYYTWDTLHEVFDVQIYCKLWCCDCVQSFKTALCTCWKQKTTRDYKKVFIKNNIWTLSRLQRDQTLKITLMHLIPRPRGWAMGYATTRNHGLRLSCYLVLLSIGNKQRVLMHGHHGWNVRHGLCHIYMIYVYIWVVYSFCLFCCLFIIVTTQFVALYKPCKPKPKPSTYDPPGQPPPGRDPKTDT